MLIQIKDHEPRAALYDGWERRFTADASRVKEAVELYRLLGFEVRTENAAAAYVSDDCGACYANAAQFKTIYTRKKPLVSSTPSR